MSSGGAGWVGTLGATAAVSLALHAGGLALAARLEPRRPPPQAPVEVAFDAVEEPPPPRAEPPPPPPPPEPAPRRVPMAKLPPPPDSKPPPPPPNQPPPPDAAPARKAVPLAGLSLSSTVESGAFAVQTGNTLYDKASEVAHDPKEVKPYAAEGTAPPPPGPRLSAQPRLLEQPDVPYPPEARRAGVEGKVKLLLRIDHQGRVVSARVLVDPGGGLGEAARAGALRFHFSPGLLDGEPVEVPDFLYTYTFVLE